MNKTLEHVIYLFIVRFMKENYNSRNIIFSLVDIRTLRSYVIIYNICNTINMANVKEIDHTH